MEIVHCITCNRLFRREEDENWKIRCYDCWLKKNGKTSNPSELQQLRQENLTLRQKNEEYEEDFSNLFKYVGFLIFACHPDRNPSKKQVAHEVMIWLNAKREQFR